MDAPPAPGLPRARPTRALEPASGIPSGFYANGAWSIRERVDTDVRAARLVETHEHFHKLLDDSTAFGSLTAIVADLSFASGEDSWRPLLVALSAMSDLVHEAFAVGMSLIVTQRDLAPLPDFPLYDHHVAVIRRLVGPDIHPWVTLAALDGGLRACMQSSAARIADSIGLGSLRPHDIPLMERPNHRLARLLDAGYANAVAASCERARERFGAETWWIESEAGALAPAALDGSAIEPASRVRAELFAHAADVIASGGGGVLEMDAHHDVLRRLIAAARQTSPTAPVRIGAISEDPAIDYLLGGALDAQSIPLVDARRKAMVVRAGMLSDVSGEGPAAHRFLVVATRRRLETSYATEGLSLPETPVVACLRATLFDGDTPRAVLLVVADDPESLPESDVPLYVSVHSSALAGAPLVTAGWLRVVEPRRASIVMDTPVVARLRAWLTEYDARFVFSVRQVVRGDVSVRVIAGRLRSADATSPLMVVPTTEFGARWFEQIRLADDLLREGTQESPDLFEEESPHLDVVLGHMLMEEARIGPGTGRT